MTTTLLDSEGAAESRMGIITVVLVCYRLEARDYVWPYSKPTVSRRNEYGRIRWTWATFQKKYGEKEKLDL
jgi:hypothetical protein